MCPSTNEYWPVEPGNTSRELGTRHIRRSYSVPADYGGRGKEIGDLRHLGIALCAASTLMMGSAATLAFIYLF